MAISISVSPHGRIHCENSFAGSEESDSGFEAGQIPVEADIAEMLLAEFARSTADGLLLLATPRMAVPLPLEFVFWRDWVRRFLKALSQLDEQQTAKLENSAKTGTARIGMAVASGSARKTTGELPVPCPDDLALAVLVSEAPPMRGLEYLTPDCLKQSWHELVDCCLRRLHESGEDVAGLLRTLNPEAHTLGRVTFHLAENRRDPNNPFAFLATYASRLSAKAQVQHLPLAEALRQYAGARDQSKLAELLAPVRQAASQSPVVSELLSSRALFSPQAWSISEAFRFLRETPTMEQAGLVVRVPDWWRTRRASRPQVQIRIGEKTSSLVGTEALLDFRATLALDGVPLTDSEREHLLSTTEGLTLLRGKWVEVDPKKLGDALQHWKQLEQERTAGISFLEGMRMLSGVGIDARNDDPDDATHGWSRVVAGEWLAEILRQVRDPAGIIGCDPGARLNAELRPYQADGVRWLWFMTRLGLGACLADDMGLGKTIQIIDLFLQLKEGPDDSRNRKSRRTSANDSGKKFLCIVPASLVGNWKQELERFAPQLRFLCAHRSECDAETLTRLNSDPLGTLENIDLVVTTYTMLRRVRWPTELVWRLIVLDEAQAIKNPGSAQSRSVRKLQSSGRIALTGTPVENRLGDLWSLFDFCCPGLLGTVRQFREFVKQSGASQNLRSYSALRKLVQPYILRRMKTDRSIIKDLPDKTELRVECGLSRKQAALYEQVVKGVAGQIRETAGVQRQGLVLSMLMRLKQLCNHPDQYLNQPDFRPEESGKFLVLRELVLPIAERQEKVLVFTQFQSMCEPLSGYLEKLFGREGVVLHGGVPVAKRKKIVQQFQEQDHIPFFVLSVKAGGTGLNLTAASHVIHFDRWWNPAVENQATDRAFRIGQKRNVLVHKFVCKGTLEERIDQMIREKSEMADSILGSGGEKLLTQMSDEELMRFVALDVTRASAD